MQVFTSYYLFHALIAIVVMFLVLVFVDSVAETALAAGLGSSVILLFVYPNSGASAYKNLLGGHIIAIIIGIMCSQLIFGFTSLEQSSVITGWLVDFIIALAIGILILVMVITKTQHPPAAGSLLGFGLVPFSVMNVVIIISALGILALLKLCARRIFRDLF